MERAIPIDPSISRFLNERQPDLLVLPGLIEFGSAHVAYVRAARALGIGTLYYATSWEDLSAKGLLHEVPDCVTVWNRNQRKDAIELHGVAPEAVAVVGAHLYESWFTAEPVISRDHFCAQLGLDPSGPIVLFVCGAPTWERREFKLVEQWIRGLRTHVDPRMRSTAVIVRPPAKSQLLWPKLQARFGNVSVVPKKGRGSRADYFHSIYYSDAVVGVDMTALFESGIVGRPFLGVIRPELTPGQRELVRFHRSTPSSSGWMRLIRDLDEHLAQLQECLDDGPGRFEGYARNTMRALLAPHGPDVPPRVVVSHVIQEMLSNRPAPIDNVSLLNTILRGVMYPPALVGHALFKLRTPPDRDDRNTSDVALGPPLTMSPAEALPEKVSRAEAKTLKAAARTAARRLAKQAAPEAEDTAKRSAGSEQRRGATSAKIG
jgi:hypothetical protein